MNEHNSDDRDFRPDYATLELNHRADWKAVRASYRQLVHLWHPDRYATRPRERVHAQQNFTSLTQSYTRLRNFHRRHGRMPFEPTGNRSTNKSMEIHTPAQRRKTSRPDSSRDSNRPSPGPYINDAEIGAGVLGREKGSRAPALDERSRKRMIWALAGVVMIMATVVIFFLLDMKANQAIIERGREVVREAPPSEFMPSAAEIRRSEAKGAFVQPTN